MRPDAVAPAGILVDIARCIGCRSCEAACQTYHGFPPGPAADLGPQAWTYVALRRLRTARPHMSLGDGGKHQRTFKVQCMHCLDPACASACPVGALRKSARGPVIYDAGRCIGCRYCMVACPFQVPRFEWHRPLPVITKCNMCAERQARGAQPVCVEACPAGALQFGPRADLLLEAARRMRAHPGRYVPAVYGAEEAGGTSVLYISDVPFEELGFPVVVREAPVGVHLEGARQGPRRRGRPGRHAHRRGGPQPEATRAPGVRSSGRPEGRDPSMTPGRHRSSGRLCLWLMVLGGVAIAVRRYLYGIGAVTALSDRFPWGLWVGFDILCGVALAAGGFTMAAIAHVLHARRYQPLVRPAVLTGFLGYLLVIIALLVDLGRPYRIWHALVMWNPRSVMFEVAWCVMLYTAVLALEFG
ncbi:MAG: 4Fe-4S dicluster domain-containing protein [Armatimonadota bacterium]|nr:4Fe-4S dicluster domain-containing protein [Armatimonadota bacterium]